MKHVLFLLMKLKLIEKNMVLIMMMERLTILDLEDIWKL